MDRTENTKVQAPRVLISKIGLDGHDRGSRIVAAYLRDAGMEVIYTPPWQTIESVVNIVRQEDVDVIGLSSLATDHLIMPELIMALEKEGLGSVPVIVGGIIPKNEVQDLLDAGVSAIFGPGTMPGDIVRCVETLALKTRESKRLKWDDQ